MTPHTTAIGTSALLDLLFENARAGLCLVAPDGTILRTNAEWLRSTGFTRDVVGEDIVELFPAARDLALALHARARAGHRVEVPRHALTSNGRETWWEASIDPVPMEGGTGLLVTAREVTAAGEPPEAVAARRELDQRCRELETTFAAIADGAILYGPDFSVVRMNRAAEEILGFTKVEHEALGPLAARAAATAVAAATGEPLRAHEVPAARALRGETVRDAQLLLRRGDGEPRLVSASAAPIRDAGGAVVGALSTFTDVTERRRAQEALRETATRYEHQVRLFEGVASTTPDFVYLFDRQGRFLYANRRLLEVWGVALADAVGRTCRELGYEQWHHDMHMREIAQVIATKAPIKGEVPFRAPLTGIFGVYEYIFTPVLGPDGEVEIIAGTTRDVTDRKRAEEALRESEERYATMFHRSPLAIAWTALPEGTIADVNEAWVKLTGIPRDEAIGKSSVELGLIGAERRQASYEQVVARGAAEVEARLLTRTGPRDVVTTAEIVTLGGRRYLLSAVQDVSDRKRSEDALRESEERLATALEAGQIGIWEYDPRAGEAEWSPLCRTLLGVPGEGPIPYARFIEAVHPDDRARADAAVSAALDPAGDGRYVVQYRVRWPDGSLHWISASGRVHFEVRDGARTAARMRGVVVDMTREKEAELALREADRRKDEFLATLSHELRNPLAPIRNALHILDRAEPGGQQAHRAKEIANRQVGHLSRLVDDLLDVTRIARGKVELRRANRDLVALAQRTAEDHRGLMQDRGLELVLEAPAHPVVVNGDEVRLSQVLGNLLSNAAKFTPAGGKVTLSLTADAHQAVIHVRDTGPGIEPELLESIFDPFTQAKQTLARSEGGLGLGLALVKGLLALHGGEVGARSGGPGAGADFVVTLPLVEPLADTAPGAGNAAASAGAPRHRVLVIDDNRDAAETLAQLIGLLGHDAEVAHDGPGALRRARERRPDLVFCDVGLPGMDGYEVARELRRLSPKHVRIIAVSGYAQPEDVARAIAAGFDGYVAKPPDPAQLESLLGN